MSDDPAEQLSQVADCGPTSNPSFRGVFTMRIVRRTFARLSIKTLKMSELPRHKPSMTFNARDSTTDESSEN